MNWPNVAFCPSLPVHDDVLLLVAHLHAVRDELELLEDALQKYIQLIDGSNRIKYLLRWKWG